MNNSELKKGQEVWVKGVVGVDGDVDFRNSAGSLIEYINRNALDKLSIRTDEKVTVPKFVAEYLESAKSVGWSFKVALNNPTDGVCDWLADRDNQETFAQAWLFGYEMVQEKLYYISIPNAYHGDFGYNKMYDNYSFYNKNDATDVRFELTEEEINKNHKSLKNFAKEVEYYE